MALVLLETQYPTETGQQIVENTTSLKGIQSAETGDW